MSDPVISGNVPLGSELPTEPMQPEPPPAPQLPPVPTPANRVVVDPMSRTIDLPSGGLYYPVGACKATISPTRGETEIGIAGTREGSPERVDAIRRAVERHCHVEGIEFKNLLLPDFAAISLHMLALSAGTDELGKSPGCEKPDCPLKAKKLTLSTLPCIYLQRATPGESTEPVEETDPMILAAMATEQAMREQDESIGFGPEIRKLYPEQIAEPFEAVISPGDGFKSITIHWRYHRVKDVDAAVEFSKQTGDQGTTIKAAMGAYLSARQIVRIDGQEVGTIVALQWWKKTPTPILKQFRAQVRARNFGYSMEPEFQCPRGDCRKKVRIMLPADGSLFRSDSA